MFEKTQENSSKTFLRRELPKPSESGEGYLLRLTKINRYQRPRDWLMAWGVIPPHYRFSMPLVLEPAVLKALSEHVGIHWVELEKALWKRLDARTIGCGKLQTRQIIWQVPGQRICPRCLAEQGFIDLRWQWFALIVCPTHRRYLVDRCECGRFLHWDRKELERCDCGQALTTLRTRKASQAQVALAQELFTAITDAMALRAKNENFHRWSAEIELFLRIQAFMKGREGPLRIRERGVNELKRPIRRLLQILNSPKGWVSLWETFTRHQRTKTGKTGYPVELRPVAHLLKSYPDATQAAASFEHYIHNLWFGLQFNAPHRTRWWTKQAVMAYLKNRGWVSRWIENGHLKTYRLPDQTPVYCRDDVLALKERLDQSLSFSEVAKRVRVSDHVLLDLLRHDLIHAWCRPDVHQVRDWRIDPDAVDQFFARLRELSESEMSPPYVTWESAIRLLQWRGFSSAKLVEKMLSGELPFFFGKVLGRVRFYPHSLNRLYQLVPEERLVSSEYVSSLLQLGYFRSVQILADRGFLSRRHFEAEGGKAFTLVFDEQEVKEFAKEHWRLTDIAQWAGCTKHGLGHKLRMLGIEPIIPNQELGGAYLFRKADVLTIRPAQLRAPTLKVNKLLKTREVAKRLSLSVPTVIAYTRRGLLRPHRGKGAEPGKTLFYTEYELELFQQRFAGEERLWDAQEVAKYLGCDRSTVLKQWMEQGYLIATKRVAGIGYLFRSCSVRRLKQYLSNTLTGPELADQLGVHRNRVFKWMQAGLITPTPYPGVPKPTIYRYHRNILPVLRKRLRKGMEVDDS